MYSIKINKKTYDLAESWDELEYYKYKKLVEVNEKKEALKSYELFSLLSGIPLDIIKKIKIQQLHELEKLANFFVNDPIPAVPTHEYINEFEIDGTIFYLREFRAETTFEEWMDFKETDDIIIQLSVMAKKKVETKKWNYKKFKYEKTYKYEKYDDYDLDERIKQFNNLDIITIKKISNFFLSNYQQLKLFTSQYSLILATLTQQVESIKSSMQAGGGMRHYNRYQIWILTKMKKHLEKSYQKCFSSIPL